MFYFWLTTTSSYDALWRKTKVFIILTRHNQTFVFVYMLEFGYYIFFEACRNEETSL